MSQAGEPGRGRGVEAKLRFREFVAAISGIIRARFPSHPQGKASAPGSAPCEGK